MLSKFAEWLARAMTKPKTADFKAQAQVFYRLVTPCVMDFFQCVASVREKSAK